MFSCWGLHIRNFLFTKSVSLDGLVLKRCRDDYATVCALQPVLLFGLCYVLNILVVLNIFDIFIKLGVGGGVHINIPSCTVACGQSVTFEESFFFSDCNYSLPHSSSWICICFDAF